MTQQHLIAPEPEDDSGFRCNLLDPPWPEEGGGGRGAQNHYPVMELPEIVLTICRCPLWRPARNAHLWLWFTDNYLDDARTLMRVLGFEYKRTFVWVKPSFGLGYYGRGQHESMLFGVRGKLPPLRACSSVITGPKRAHSQKPEESFSTIEATSPGPRLEIFARQNRPGWTSWGNDPNLSPAT